jgi:hypothetical protein
MLLVIRLLSSAKNQKLAMTITVDYKDAKVTKNVLMIGRPAGKIHVSINVYN